MTKSIAEAAAVSLRKYERLKAEKPTAFMEADLVLKGMIDRREFTAFGHPNSPRGVEAFLLKEGGFRSGPTAHTHMLMARAFEHRDDHDRIDAMGWSKASAIARVDQAFHDEGLAFAETSTHKGSIAWASRRKQAASAAASLFPVEDKAAVAPPVFDHDASSWIREQVSRRVNEILDEMQGAGTPQEIADEFMQMIKVVAAAGMDMASILSSKGTKSEREAVRNIIGMDLWSSVA
jgi:hypothetical protein